MNRILGYLSALVVFVAVFVWVLSQKPSHAIEDKRPERSVEAKNLSAGFYQDEALANETYLNRIIAVEGEVLQVISKRNKTEVWLKGIKNGPDIRCLLSNRTDNSRVEYQNGARVKLKGICTGLTDHVELMQCEEL